MSGFTLIFQSQEDNCKRNYMKPKLEYERLLYISAEFVTLPLLSFVFLRVDFAPNSPFCMASTDTKYSLLVCSREAWLHGKQMDCGDNNILSQDQVTVS